MKTYGVELYIHEFLFSASLSNSFTFRERAPGVHWIGDWVGLRADLDDVEKREFFTYRDSNSDLSVVQPVASRYTDYAIPASKTCGVEVYVHAFLFSASLSDRFTFRESSPVVY
jgi:hypothetical protein